MSFKYAALLAAVINFLSSLAMLLFLNPALDPKNSLAAKLQYLLARPGAWTGSWILWIFAALSLILLLIHWGTALDHFTEGRSRPWIIFGTLIACLGLIPDTIAEVLYLGTLPDLAKQTLAHGDIAAISSRFHDWENTALLLTGFLGNGLYCLGGLTLQSFTLKYGALPRFCRYFGFVVWICGLALSTAVLFKSSVGMYLLTALTMASFILWSFFLGTLRHPRTSS
ncbi:MAG TPA: hypothetical protein DF383_08430 [Deltaproteobacteria bacterium]|nr:hypothetical protein [Deltaproteobacteria bacterium]